MKAFWQAAAEGRCRPWSSQADGSNNQHPGESTMAAGDLMGWYDRRERSAAARNGSACDHRDP